MELQLAQVVIGSQNYGLADEHSDTDTFVFTAPATLESLVNDAPKNDQVVSEGGITTYKDFRLLAQILRKTSFTSTEYILGTNVLAQRYPWSMLVENRKLIALGDPQRLVTSTAGIVHNMLRNFEHTQLNKYIVQVLLVTTVVPRIIEGDDPQDAYRALAHLYFPNRHEKSTHVAEDKAYAESLLRTFLAKYDNKTYTNHKEEVNELLRAWTTEVARIVISEEH